MGADQRGSNPTPVIPSTWGASGNTFTPVGPSNPLPVKPVESGASTITGGGAQTAVPVSTTSVSVAAANSSRIRLRLYNDGPNTAYLNHSAAAAVATGEPLRSGGRMILEGEDAKLAWNAICAATESASIRVATGVTS